MDEELKRAWDVFEEIKKPGGLQDIAQLLELKRLIEENIEKIKTAALAGKFSEAIAWVQHVKAEDLIRRSGLTPQELIVFERAALGHINKQIAYGLGVSEITVKVHIGHLMTKLSGSIGSRITNRTQLALLYWGITRDEITARENNLGVSRPDHKVEKPAARHGREHD